MQPILHSAALSLVVVFLALAAIHVYWALGGRWGVSAKLPEVGGTRAFHPGRATFAATAMLFGAAALIVALRAGLVRLAWVPRLVPEVGIWVVTVALLLRALGDFRLVGLFKRVRHTGYARRDNRYFTPLSIALALGCALVGLG